MKLKYYTILAGIYASIFIGGCQDNGFYEIVHQQADITIQTEIVDGVQKFSVKDSAPSFKQTGNLNFVNDEGGLVSFLGPEHKNNHRFCYSSYPISDYPNDLWSKDVKLGEFKIVYIKFRKGGKLTSHTVNVDHPDGNEYKDLEADVRNGGVSYTELVDRLAKINPKELSFIDKKIVDDMGGENHTPFDEELGKVKRHVFVYVLLNKKNVKFQEKPGKALLSHRPSVVVHSPYNVFVPRDSDGKRHKNIIVADFYRGGDIKQRVEKLAKIRKVPVSEVECSYPYDLGVVLNGQNDTTTKIFIDPSNGSKGPP